jgi:hypothetical protein
MLGQQTEGGYYTGYIVDAQGDTIQGRIVRESNYINPEKIEFNANGSDQEYTALNAQAFYINDLDLLFESYTIDKNADNNTFSPIAGEYTNKTSRGRHFLLTIAKTSDYGFYAFTDEDGRERLYFRQGETQNELLNLRKYVYEGDVQLTEEKKRYRIQLLGFLIGCDGLNRSINTAGYDRGSMLGLLVRYAKCKGDEVLFRPGKKQIVIKYGIAAGIGSVISSESNSINNLSAGQSRRGNAEHVAGSFFEFGLAARIGAIRDSRFAYKAELKFKSQTIETIWNRPIPVNNILSRETYTYNNTYASVAVLGNVNLLRWDKGVIFLELGAYLGTSLSGDVEISTGVYQGNDQYTFTDSTTDTGARETDTGVIVGLGAEIGRLAVSFRYNSSIADETQPDLDLSLKMSGASLNLIYLFN